MPDKLEMYRHLERTYRALAEDRVPGLERDAYVSLADGYAALLRIKETLRLRRPRLN